MLSWFQVYSKMIQLYIYIPFIYSSAYMLGFPGSSAGKESACNAGDPSSIPGLRRPPGERDGYPLQYSALENAMDRGSMGLQIVGHN